jgi:hypothetical protein
MGWLASGGGRHKQGAELEGQHAGIEVGRGSIGGQGHESGVNIDEPRAALGLFAIPRRPRAQGLGEFEHRLHALALGAGADQARQFPASGNAAVSACQQT